jgi:hypothetical protein
MQTDSRKINLNQYFSTVFNPQASFTGLQSPIKHPIVGGNKDWQNHHSCQHPSFTENKSIKTSPLKNNHEFEH